MPAGRPSSMTPAKVDTICASIASGLSLVKTCQLPGTPDPETVRAWTMKSAEFLVRYREARAQQAETWADEIVDISDNCDQTHEAIAKAKLRVHTRQWVAARLLPDYMEKRHLEHASVGVGVVVNVVLDERPAGKPKEG